MTEISSQSDESKVLIKENTNIFTSSLPSLVSWSAQFSTSQNFTSNEFPYEFHRSKVKVEIPESKKNQPEMEGRNYSDKCPDDNLSNLNDEIHVLKLVPNMTEHSPDQAIEQTQMYNIPDVNIIVPMYCHDVMSEHGVKHLENKMDESKSYIIQPAELAQQQLMSHFQHQQEFLSHWPNTGESPSHINLSYEPFNQEYVDVDFQTIQQQHFQHQQSHHHQHQETASNPAKKKRRRIITTDQRRAANIRERRRMSHLNEAFDGLRKRVPTFAYEKKLSRIETLKLAVTYIKFMSNLLESLDAPADSSHAGFHSDQKLLSNHFHPSVHHHMNHRFSDKNVLISPNRSSMATDDDESLDGEENGDVLVSLQGSH